MKRIFILLAIGSVFALLTLLWWRNGTAPQDPLDKSQKIFVIKPGEDVREIANNLKKEGLIRNPVVFFLVVKQEGIDGKIQAGDFRLSPSMTAPKIAEALTHGTIDAWVTIPEGQRAEEIAEILEKKILTYNPSWKEVLKQHEGYLFPDSYLIPKNADIDLIVSIMRNNFEEKYAGLGAPNHNLSKKDIIIVSSLVEREAKYPQDRPLVASVILNRLQIGMKLDIDATLQYILGYQESEKRWWKKALTNQDKRIISPYNTYLNPGLPPAPIANPGLASIQAVFNPARTDYLYYLSDKNGRNHYSKTLEEHEANIKKYGL